MATNKKRIQAYVSHSTYESLKSLAEDRNMSLSEYVGELLQTQSVSTNSSNEIVIGNSDVNGNYVTKEQLLKMFTEFRSEIGREIAREVSRAEVSWEERAATLVSIQDKAFEMFADPEKAEKSFAAYKKGRR